MTYKLFIVRFIIVSSFDYGLWATILHDYDP